MQSDADKAELPIGFRVGDYVVKESVASGGFGSVYRVEHATKKTFAALKVLHAELASASEAVLRFEREVEVIQRLHHPNVVEIFESGRLADGRPYFVMELLIGVDLDTHMRSKGRLTPSDILSILEALCSALSLAHANGIIHRDLKASNVFLSAKDGKRRVVLLDFGVAKLLDDQVTQLTPMFHVVGTPFAMAPEQVLGQAMDARTDVYALGGLVYYMLTGELPFQDRSVAMVQHMQVSMQPRKPSAVAPVGTMFDEVLLRALSKTPAGRPSSVDEFLGEVRSVLSGRTIESARQYERRMAAIHIEAYADPEAMEDGDDDDLFTDMEKCLPFARNILVQKGYMPAVILPNTMLLVKELPAGDREGLARREAVRTAMALDRQLQTRPTFDERVGVRICLHVGTVQVAGGKLVEGELLELSSWLPRSTWQGVVGSPQVFADLGLTTQPALDAKGFLRVVEGHGPPSTRLM